jgi:hypothetical protein
MKAYISDPEDLKQDSTYQEIWDDMIINVSTLFLLIEDYIQWCLSALHVLLLARCFCPIAKWNRSGRKVTAHCVHVSTFLSFLGIFFLSLL